MNEIMIFNNPEFGSVRTADVDGKTYFCGNDIATALGYKQPADAIRNHCKGVYEISTPTNSGKQMMKYITEGDVYRLITHSKLPEAEKFERWVFDEVLPSIRKTGSYSINQKPDSYMIDDPIERAKRWIEEAEERKALAAKVEENKPLVVFANSVETAKTSILIGDLAKILKQNGVDIGRKRLFAWLRDNGYLMKGNSTSKNMPTQRSMEAGLFEIKEGTFNNPDGTIGITKTPKVTGKGQIYFINKFLGKAE